jgi:hypothetical protein
MNVPLLQYRSHSDTAKAVRGDAKVYGRKKAQPPLATALYCSAENRPGADQLQDYLIPYS